MKHKCEECGHEQEVNFPFEISQVKGWEKGVLSSTPGRLLPRFGAVSGELPKPTACNSSTVERYTTLFLSAMGKCGLEEDWVQEARKLCFEKVLPALVKIDLTFDVIGHIVLPSFMPLAMTELLRPYATFCFVTVKNIPGLGEKLSSVGLSRVGPESEGLVDTLGDPQGSWFDAEPDWHEGIDEALKYAEEILAEVGDVHGEDRCEEGRARYASDDRKDRALPADARGHRRHLASKG